MRGLFVTGTDTGVGKTVVAGAIVAALRHRGSEVRALKPVITGLDEPADPDWPHDHELLALAAASAPEEVALRRFGPAVSPHLAAAMTGTSLDVAQLLDEVRGAGKGGETLLVEGVGGLLVPLADGWDVRRFAAELGLPLIVAARPGLGTINHTLLTLHAARAAGLRVAAVVLTPWPETPGEIERSNVASIEALGAVEVALLPYVPRGAFAPLAAAGAALPLERWLGPATSAQTIPRPSGRGNL